MVTFISSQSDLQNWNGNSDMEVTSNFNINGSYSSLSLGTFTFDARGYVITVVSSPSFMQPLFNTLSGGTIKNLNYQASNCVPNPSYIVSNFLGTYGYINNINLIGANINNNTVPGINLGGIIGISAGGNGSPNVLIISDCSVTGNISGSSNYKCGGIASFGAGTYSANGLQINNCFVNATINQYGGGIIAGGGGSKCTITSCLFNGTLGNFTGGISGGSDNDTITILNCYSIASSISGADNLGGIIGPSKTGPMIENSYFISNTSSTNMRFVANYASGSPISVTGCATSQSDFYSSYLADLVNCRADITPTGSAALSPFNSWSTTYWAGIGLTIQNLVLKSFQSQNWNPPNYVINTDIPVLNLPITCLLKGSYILTPEGEKIIENLKVGDILSTIDGFTKITYIQTQESYIQPYLISQNYFGDLPNKDLNTSPTHGLYINGEWFHPKCSNLSRNIKNIKYEYYHIKTENEDDLIIVNGMVSETLRKKGNKCKFCQ